MQTCMSHIIFLVQFQCFLSEILPDAIRTGCSKCSEEQIKVARKVSDKLRKDHKDIWDKLSDKYDPEGTYRLKYKKELIEAGFMD